MISNKFETQKPQGFSLVEIAIVLVIIAILITAVGIPLATQIEQQRTVDTQKQLEQIKEALYGYAMANGRLPCPATDGVIFGVGSPSSNGAESFAVGGDMANGNCLSFTGYVPAVTLGFSSLDADKLLVDAWGLQQNRIRYAVRGLSIVSGTPAACSVLPNPFVNPITQTDGIKSINMSCLASTNAAINLLTINASSVNNIPAGCSQTALTTKAPFVLISLGKNAPTGGIGADEAANMLANTTTFVSHTPTATGSCAGEFDDIVTWGNLNTLFARMVQAGKLP
jgi:prepilin-type N-terminal cleavage/methylation domain-containing protein